jgi:hypothetical protein
VWLITLLAYGGVMGLMHPIMRENDALMQEQRTSSPRSSWPRSA